MLTAKKYDELLEVLTPCAQPNKVITKALYKESKNNFGICIFYADLSPKVAIAFEGIAACRKGFKSDCIDSICVRVTKVSPIIREQFKMLHEYLITHYPQYKDFSYKPDAFDDNGYLVIYDKINNRFKPFDGCREIAGNLHPFNCTLSGAIKLNYKIIGTPIIGTELDPIVREFKFDEEYDMFGNKI